MSRVRILALLPLIGWPCLILGMLALIAGWEWSFLLWPVGAALSFGPLMGLDAINGRSDARARRTSYVAMILALTGCAFGALELVAKDGAGGLIVIIAEGAALVAGAYSWRISLARWAVALAFVILSCQIVWIILLAWASNGAGSC